jgi:uncharacterized protein DUF3185
MHKEAGHIVETPVEARVGIMASTSFTSDISRFFTGSPTDKAIWMLVGGVVASVVGAVGLLRG